MRAGAEALRMARRSPSANKLPPPHVLQQAEAAATQFAASQREALRSQAWNGSWFSRAWVDEQEGWVGTAADDRLCLEPQSWAMLGGAAPRGGCASLLRHHVSCVQRARFCRR